jgi:dTDP-4-dehydrorhamnose reductase
MRLLVLGAAGQIGRAASDAAGKQGWETFGPTRNEIDICNREAVSNAVLSYAPTAILNAAGYTAVDSAEENQEQAFRVNRDGVRVLAEIAKDAKLPIVHLSTDYVFNGRATTPYTEDDKVDPLSIYAKSKEAGERAVRETAPRHVILRTAWVYSPYRKNFLRTMLELGSSRSELRVVNDQMGNPTFALDLGRSIVTILEAIQSKEFDRWGTYHCVGPEADTWYDFAKKIFDCSSKFGVRPPSVVPVSSRDFPTLAPRPRYSVLSTAKLENCFGIKPRPLSESIEECVASLTKTRN